MVKFIKHHKLLIISDMYGGGVNYPFSLADIVFTRLSAIGAGSRFFVVWNELYNNVN